MINAMDYQGRIVIDPEIRFGKPCVRGTRITVGDVLSYLASGMREDQILADFPTRISQPASSRRSLICTPALPTSAMWPDVYLARGCKTSIAQPTSRRFPSQPGIEVRGCGTSPSALCRARRI